jgi:hypothetical protein
MAALIAGESRVRPSPLAPKRLMSNSELAGMGGAASEEAGSAAASAAAPARKCLRMGSKVNFLNAIS